MKRVKREGEGSNYNNNNNTTRVNVTKSEAKDLLKALPPKHKHAVTKLLEKALKGSLSHDCVFEVDPSDPNSVWSFIAHNMNAQFMNENPGYSGLKIAHITTALEVAGDARHLFTSITVPQPSSTEISWDPWDSLFLDQVIKAISSSHLVSFKWDK